MYSLSGPILNQGSKAFAGTTNSVTGQTITLKGDMVFEGTTPVPLPASVWLLSSAIALFGLTLVDRRRVLGNPWKFPS